MPSTLDASGTVIHRALTPEDASEVFELTAAVEQHDTGSVLVELDDIVADWARPSYDLSTQSRGVFDDGRLVAYAEVDRLRVEGHVHPAARGRGLGSLLLSWATKTGRRLGYERVGQSLPVTNRGAIELFRSFGSDVLYTSWILELPPDVAVAGAGLPPGHRMREFDPGRDARAVFQTIEDAFNEWPNRLPSTFEDWEVATLQRSDFEPWQVIVMVEDVEDGEGGEGGERIVGACKVTSHDGMGWVDQIAVRRDARGRGLGRALLVGAFSAARAHGATSSRLNTDSRTGALGLYQHVGMVVAESYEHHAIRLGEPASTGAS